MNYAKLCSHFIIGCIIGAPILITGSRAHAEWISAGEIVVSNDVNVTSPEESNGAGAGITSWEVQTSALSGESLEPGQAAGAMWRLEKRVVWEWEGGGTPTATTFKLNYLYYGEVGLHTSTGGGFRAESNIAIGADANSLYQFAGDSLNDDFPGGQSVDISDVYGTNGILSKNISFTHSPVAINGVPIFYANIAEYSKAWIRLDGIGQSATAMALTDAWFVFLPGE